MTLTLVSVMQGLHSGAFVVKDGYAHIGPNGAHFAHGALDRLSPTLNPNPKPNYKPNPSPTQAHPTLLRMLPNPLQTCTMEAWVVANPRQEPQPQRRR